MIKTKRPIFFSGENPGMTLLVPGTEQVAAVASYWYCTDSPWGVGHALVLWLAASEPGFGHGGVFTDNLGLARILIENLTQYFPEFRDVPVSSLPFTEAHCGHNYNGTSYQVLCQANNTRVELEWLDVLDRKQIIWAGFPAGKAAYDLTTAICPCRIGYIKLNGKLTEGEVKIAQGADGVASSTAFLAFAETWVGPIALEQATNLAKPPRRNDR